MTGILLGLSCKARAAGWRALRSHTNQASRQNIFYQREGNPAGYNDCLAVWTVCVDFVRISTKSFYNVSHVSKISSKYSSIFEKNFAKKIPY